MTYDKTLTYPYHERARERLPVQLARIITIFTGVSYERCHYGRWSRQFRTG